MPAIKFNTANTEITDHVEAPPKIGGQWQQWQTDS